MIQQQLRELAKQGNTKALALLVQTELGQKISGLRVKVTLERKFLFVYLQSDEVPEEEVSVIFVRQLVKDLKLNSFNQVEIYGWRKGKQRPAWNSKFQIDKKASFLPKGCILRKATIQDKSEIKQMLGQYLFEVNRSTLTRIQKEMPRFRFLCLIILVSCAVSIAVEITSNPDIWEIVNHVIDILIYTSPLTLLWINIFLNGRIPIRLSNSDLLNFWVIEYNRQLVAFGELKQGRKGSCIERLFVEKSWRRKGLGSALVKCFIREATHPIEVVPLLEYKSLYTQFGFVNTSTSSVTLIYKG